MFLSHGGGDPPLQAAHASHQARCHTASKQLLQHQRRLHSRLKPLALAPKHLLPLKGEHKHAAKLCMGTHGTGGEDLCPVVFWGNFGQPTQSVPRWPVYLSSLAWNSPGVSGWPGRHRQALAPQRVPKSIPRPWARSLLAIKRIKRATRPTGES
jgi:hypothetical protein